MGPGPSDVHPNILAAMGRPTIGHLDPEFIRMMDEMKALIQYAFQTENELTFCVSAPGSAGKSPEQPQRAKQKLERGRGVCAARNCGR